ncbi:MAG: hypothetical protein HYU59_13500 [Magnetospirillum gryphiswaldense]|uniref:hypothetical protein n=1 Tax=Magnetospirillum sp. 64-120 TaxID=1895778 RepID=UPI00092AC2AC|nr:hypothetical protein [Magnetospirillum sp. 64-120]MBI2241803.1 hypothetical protein [Magnetospirillum gryphiswaldense]OJX68051.1 MAG: hypothetical protein BGO92_05160 [Magnetospirillum sp. 64-120]
MSVPRQVSQDLEKASSMVMTARRLLATGTTIDLTALEGRIKGVCDQVVELPRDLGKGLIPALEKLIGDLDRLAEMVAERMDPPGAVAPVPGRTIDGNE